MASIGPTEIRLALVGLVMAGIVAAILSTWFWLITSLCMRLPILPQSPMVTGRQTRWGVGTVALTFVVFYVVGRLIITSYAVITARIKAASLGEFLKAVASNSQIGALLPSEQMALSVVVNSVLLVVVPSLLWLTCGARLRDLGIRFEGWLRQATVGCAAALAAAPCVYLIQWLSLRVFENHEHPLQKMLLKEFSAGVAELAILAAVVTAPLFEELFFRGILQSWLVRLADLWALARSGPPLGDIEIGSELVPPYEPGLPAPSADVQADSGHLAEPAANPPAGPATGAGRLAPWFAIGATSLLFALVHGAQWPAPIGLFVLALVIGTIYYRTGSLIAAITTHATFNAISTLMLIGGSLALEINESKKHSLPLVEPANIHILPLSDAAAHHSTMTICPEMMHRPIDAARTDIGQKKNFPRNL